MGMIETKTANAIRVLSADAIQKAKSGHPGLPLGCASAAYELWANHMRHNPADPKFLHFRILLTVCCKSCIPLFFWCL